MASWIAIFSLLAPSLRFGHLLFYSFNFLLRNKGRRCICSVIFTTSALFVLFLCERHECLRKLLWRVLLADGIQALDLSVGRGRRIMRNAYLSSQSNVALS